MREAEKQEADRVNREQLAGIGRDLMNRFNHDLTDPAEMAVLGHDTKRGYEFCVERHGRTAVVSVEWDLE